MSFKKKGRILDVGCGDGGFLLHLKERGWEAYGVDVSTNACRLARERLGQNVFNCELKDCRFHDRYFDVITLNHVLEHISDPNEEHRELHRILKNDGILLLSTPNINSFQFKISKERWFGLDFPRHLHHYSPKTLKLCLEKNGFEIVKISYPLFYSPLCLFYSLTAKFKLKKPFVPLMGALLLINLLPPFRGSMEIVAQKMLSCCHV